MTRPTSMEARRSELLTDIEECVGHTLKQDGIPENTADTAAAAVTDALVTNWAGQQLTIPGDYATRRKVRDADILARMGAVSVAELAKEYGISERAVRKVYHRARARQQQARNGGAA